MAQVQIFFTLLSALAISAGIDTDLLLVALAALPVVVMLLFETPAGAIALQCLEKTKESELSKRRKRLKLLHRVGRLHDQHRAQVVRSRLSGVVRRGNWSSQGGESGAELRNRFDWGTTLAILLGGRPAKEVELEKAVTMVQNHYRGLKGRQQVQHKQKATLTEAMRAKLEGEVDQLKAALAQRTAELEKALARGLLVRHEPYDESTWPELTLPLPSARGSALVRSARLPPPGASPAVVPTLELPPPRLSMKALGKQACPREHLTDDATTQGVYDAPPSARRSVRGTTLPSVQGTTLPSARGIALPSARGTGALTARMPLQSERGASPSWPSITPRPGPSLTSSQRHLQSERDASPEMSARAAATNPNVTLRRRIETLRADIACYNHVNKEGFHTHNSDLENCLQPARSAMQDSPSLTSSPPSRLQSARPRASAGAIAASDPLINDSWLLDA